MAKKSETTKKQITAAAIHVFGTKPYREASISEIARLANVAEGSIYQYFKSKEELFFYIPQERTAAFCDGLNLHLLGIQDALNKISKFVWYYLYFFKTNPDYARIVMLDMRVNKGFLKTKSYRLMRQFASMLLDIIKEGQNEKSIRDDINPYIIRQLILGVLEHGVTRWLLKGEKRDLLEFHREIADIVLNGIKIKDTREKKMEIQEAAVEDKPEQEIKTNGVIFQDSKNDTETI